VSWKRFGQHARIDFMPAGRQGPAYSRKLSAFNWVDFYERLDGRRLLGIAREQMCRIYDYVLIDSRTGVSDTSGICTIEMPDLLVICFTLNEQSIKGASGICESVLEHQQLSANRLDEGVANARPRSRVPGPKRILPVPTRVEITAERDKREIALNMAESTFAPLLEPLSADDQRKYWGGVQMAYFPYYAFEEIPAVFGDKPDQLLSLTTAIKQLTRVITEPPIGELPLLDPDHQVAEQIRKEIVGWYLRPVLRQPEPVRLAQQQFDALDEDQRGAMRRVLLRLVTPGTTTGQTARPASWNELSDSDARIADLLVQRRLLIVSEASRQRIVSFREPVVAEQWKVLSEWVEADRRFLVWRMTLTGATERWLQSSHDESALLRGKLLEEVDAWLPARRDDLSQAEREFIRASHARNEEEKRSQDEIAARASAATQRANELEEKLRLDLPRNAPSGLSPRLRLVIGASVGLTAVIGAALVYTLQTSRAESEALRIRLEQIQTAPAVPAKSSMTPNQSCPDLQKIELPPPTLRTTFTTSQSHRLDRECVIQSASTFGGRTGVRDAMIVPFILWANGLEVNPYNCESDCLQRGLSVTKDPRPGDVAVDSGGGLGFFVGGSRYVIWTTPTPARRTGLPRFLRVPYDNPAAAQ
jgi:hypothetical protein